MTLRELIEKASSDLDVYKEPDVSEAKTRLDEILLAGGRGMIRYEYLTALRFEKGRLLVFTDYADGTDFYEIPEHVIDAADPVRAMRLHAAERQVITAGNQIAALEKMMLVRREELKAAKAVLAALGA
jgi:hypothetical protein